MSLVYQLANTFADWLIARAARTPYYHLTGYMLRFWLVPYRQVVTRERTGPHAEPALTADGTGPVSWRRPLARLLQRLDVAVRVHCILRSDHGRDPHDHPWPYLTIILRGGYYEHRYDATGAWVDRRWRGPGSVLLRRARSLHKLELPHGGVCWTLFCTGAKQQVWGFKPADGPKVPYYDYEARS